MKILHTHHGCEGTFKLLPGESMVVFGKTEKEFLKGMCNDYLDCCEDDNERAKLIQIMQALEEVRLVN